MSIDLVVYSARPMDSADQLITLRPWNTLPGGGFQCGAKNWQVVVNPSTALDPAEDSHLMRTVLRVQPDAAFVTTINVEGKAPGEAVMIAQGSAQLMAFRLGGVVYSGASDALILPLSEGLLATMPGL